MTLISRLHTLLTPLLHPMGLRIVRILMEKDRNLQVMIERLDYTPLNMDYCVQASKVISDALDETDPIKESYSLEVTSPGSDRPLLTPEDFQHFTGSMIQGTLLRDKGRKVKGMILRADDYGFDMTVIQRSSKQENVTMTLLYDDISHVKLHPNYKF